MLRFSFRCVFVAVLIGFAMCAGGRPVCAGTTGVLTGTLVDATTKKPLVGAKISVASPSQIATVTSDSTGRFAILSLAPDTYTLSVELAGYEVSSLAGVTIFADNSRDVAISASKIVKTIAVVQSKPASALVKAGTTADVYSIDTTAQAKVAAAGGGGNLDSAYSALATVPGVVVASGGSGYGTSFGLSIRGGDYYQVGYEIDGVPVNRAFDNEPSGQASSLGQQELEIYTGGPLSDSQSYGISGYINQVIKTGTSPGFETVTIADGGPAFYHKAAVEIGGASADRRFSYYVGVGGYNQTQRIYDNFNGASLSNAYGTPAAFCTPGSGTPLSRSVAPSCYNGAGQLYPAYTGALDLGPFDQNYTSLVQDRDNVVNLHYYFPHKDGSRDDLQALYIVNSITTGLYTSTNDQGGAAFLDAAEATFGYAPTYADGYQLKLPTGGFLPANYQQYAAAYYFPNTPTHAFGATIDPNFEDGEGDNQAISKIEFTKALGSKAYARVYGYAYYSNHDVSGPNSSDAFYGGAGADYQLSSHTRGASFTVADQINSQNLLAVAGDYTTATVARDNNFAPYSGSAYATGPGSINAGTAAAVLVDSSHPSNGICYTASAVATSCFGGASILNATGYGGSAPTSDPVADYLSVGQLATTPGITAPNLTCGSGPCRFLVIGNGQYGLVNAVTPKFYAASLNDEFRPNAKLTVNAGIRLDDYQYVGSDTSGGVAREFFYNAYDNEECVSNTTQLVSQKLTIGDTSIAQACPAGYRTVMFQNPSGGVTQTYPVFQPRIGATFSVDANTVLRASFGRFSEPASSAYEQYNVAQSEAPAQLYGVYGFQQYGFDSPNHRVPPATSNNYDFSIEHQFPQQISIKVTPFLRLTQNQNEDFYLNRSTGFISGLNVGNQTSRGFELEIDKGNFSQQGLSAKLSFGYTNSYIAYDNLSNGTTVLTPVVNAINAYNALTKKGGGAPCYTPAVYNATTGAETLGTPQSTCAAGEVANPYYDAPEQSTEAYAAGAISIPYDVIPAGIGVSSTAIGVPYNTSLVLNEKIGKVAITPVLQYFAGQRYGNPLGTNGIDPTTCTAVLAGSTTGDPRYNYGAAGGSPYDASSCSTLASGIPNLQTGTFDGIGAYVEPSQILLSAQLSYQVSKSFSLTANLANLVNTCFGGSKVPWTVPGACGYSYAGYGVEPSVGNAYNPGDAIQPALRNTYAPVFSQRPFALFVSGDFKI
jgi:hypothetical protein